MRNNSQAYENLFSWASELFLIKVSIILVVFIIHKKANS